MQITKRKAVPHRVCGARSKLVPHDFSCAVRLVSELHDNRNGSFGLRLPLICHPIFWGYFDLARVVSVRGASGCFFDSHHHSLRPFWGEANE